MHSIGSLLCNFLLYKNTVNTTGYVHNFFSHLVLEVLVNIALLCNREHNKYKAL